ncbi:MAG: hypothetical protein ACE5JL_12010 [Dehalococcoidia bacterium]
MGLKKSTGRGTRLRHSTGLEWDDLEKAKKHYAPLRYSTGENPSVRHFTGTQFDWKVLRRLSGESEEAPENPRLHSIPAKAQEDTTYLDLHMRSRAKEARGGRVEEAQGRDREIPREDERAGETRKKEALERFTPMALDY